jgi:dipeptidyl aminopeptidase/acylaminoacyl peptidase
MRYCVTVLLLLIPVAASGQPAPLTVEKIMQEPKSWVGDWPENPRWGAAGEYLYFDWNPKGRFPADSLFRVPRSGGEPTKVPPGERRGSLPFFDGWRHGEHVYDSGRKVYADEGDLYVFDREEERLRRLTRTQSDERNPRFTPSGEAVVYRRGNNLFRAHLTTGAVRQLTDLSAGQGPSDAPADDSTFLEKQQRALFETIRKQKREDERREKAQRRDRQADPSPPTFYAGGRSVQQLRLRPGGRYVTFTLYDSPDGRERGQVIDYVTESGYARTRGARAKVGRPGGVSQLYVQDLRRDTTYRVDLAQLPSSRDVPASRRKRPDAPDSLDRSPRAYGPYWSGNGEHAVIDVRSRDNKDRWLARLNPRTGDLTVLDRQHDDAWIAGPGITWGGGSSEVGWYPDGERFYFQSEETGYSHLYAVNVETGEKTQLTSGDFEVADPRLSRDGATWLFRSTRHSPHSWQVYRTPADVGSGEATRLTKPRGGNVDAFAPSPDGERLALLRSKKNRPPEVHLMAMQRAESLRRVTHSPTEAWQRYDWRDPEVVHFEASDGAQVPAQVYRPDDPNGASVLFVHGAGYLQNVKRGWGHYFREYMFHNLLAERGYTVMNVDYRGSAGYGRDWRTAIYRHMGGRDVQDYVDAQRYLKRKYGIGPERSFIYGGSYGGFLTLMALFTEPEHFGGGAALRAVTDWAHYNHTYTANILNTPQTDSLAYARSSPIYHAEGLEDPLLIAHGVMDRNVLFQDVARLAQRLIELGKEDWELALYPVEGHGFEEPSSWTDEYRRILELIEESVGPRRTGPTSVESSGAR